jgi:hypothetical protein
VKALSSSPSTEKKNSEEEGFEFRLERGGIHLCTSGKELS